MITDRSILRNITCFLLSLIVTACATNSNKIETSANSTDSATTSGIITSDNANQGAAKTTGSESVAVSNIQAVNLASWHATGKVAVQSSKNSGSASVDWAQHQRHYDIALVGPMGSHRMQISGQPGNVNLVTGDGKHFHANSPEELLSKQWGFRLPLSNLYYWMRGLPVPGIPSKSQYDSKHRLTRLIQQNWDIQYLSYTQRGALELPEKLYATSPSLRVKVIVYQWKI